MACLSPSGCTHFRTASHVCALYSPENINGMSKCAAQNALCNLQGHYANRLQCANPHYAPKLLERINWVQNRIDQLSQSTSKTNHSFGQAITTTPQPTSSSVPQSSRSMGPQPTGSSVPQPSYSTTSTSTSSTNPQTSETICTSYTHNQKFSAHLTSQIGKLQARQKPINGDEKTILFEIIDLLTNNSICISHAIKGVHFRIQDDGHFYKSWSEFTSKRVASSSLPSKSDSRQYDIHGTLLKTRHIKFFSV